VLEDLPRRILPLDLFLIAVAGTERFFATTGATNHEHARPYRRGVTVPSGRASPNDRHFRQPRRREKDRAAALGIAVNFLRPFPLALPRLHAGLRVCLAIAANLALLEL
jgi:hypothetical protein